MKRAMELMRGLLPYIEVHGGDSGNWLNELPPGGTEQVVTITFGC